MAELSQVVRSLPSSIPLAVATDDLAAYSGHPRDAADDDEDDPWEGVDRALNRTIGYGQTNAQISAIIRRGPLGMDGLVSWLEKCISDLGINEGLLEGKIGRLVDAMLLWCAPSFL